LLRIHDAETALEYRSQIAASKHKLLARNHKNAFSALGKRCATSTENI